MAIRSSLVPRSTEFQLGRLVEAEAATSGLLDQFVTNNYGTGVGVRFLMEFATASRAGAAEVREQSAGAIETASIAAAELGVGRDPSG